MGDTYEFCSQYIIVNDCSFVICYLSITKYIWHKSFKTYKYKTSECCGLNSWIILFYSFMTKFLSVLCKLQTLNKPDKQNLSFQKKKQNTVLVFNKLCAHFSTCECNMVSKMQQWWVHHFKIHVHSRTHSIFNFSG